jgi:hypothetical protein
MKNMKNISQNSQHPGQESNWAPPKYKSNVTDIASSLVQAVVEDTWTHFHSAQ